MILYIFHVTIAQLYPKIFINCTIFSMCPKLFNNCTIFAKFEPHFSGRVSFFHLFLPFIYNLYEFLKWLMTTKFFFHTCCLTCLQFFTARLTIHSFLAARGMIPVFSKLHVWMNHLCAATSFSQHWGNKVVL